MNERHSADAPGVAGTTSEGMGVSTASLVLGILGVVAFGFLTGIPAIIAGHRALKRRYAGRGMATAGVVLGWVAIAVCIAVAGVALLGIAGYLLLRPSSAY